MSRCPVFRDVVLEDDGVVVAFATYEEGKALIGVASHGDPMSDRVTRSWVESEIFYWLLFGDLSKPPHDLWRWSCQRDAGLRVIDGVMH